MCPASVDVLMPVHNGADYLPQSLRSVQAMEGLDGRIVVVDDGSTDGTPDILRAAAERDRRIRIVRLDRNSRVAAALNAGLRECRAPLVARADADDLYAPSRLLRQMSLLALEPGVGVVSCGFHRIDEEGTRLSTIDPVTGHDKLSFHSRFMNGFLHSGVVFRRSVVEAVGGYDERYWTAQDSDLWDRLRGRTRFENVPEPLVSYRVSSGSVMKTRGTEGQRLSLTVPQRALSSYIGREIDLDETVAATRLYQGFEVLGLDTIELALRTIREVDGVAQRTETDPVKRAFRRRMATMLARQARWAGRQRPGDVARLLKLSASWRFAKTGARDPATGSQEAGEARS